MADGAHHGARPARVDAGGQPLPRRDGRPAARVGRHDEPEVLPRPRRRLAEAAHQAAVAREGLLAGDLLLDDRGHQGLHDQPGAGHPPAGERGATPAPPAGGGRRSRRVVTLAEQVGHPLEHPRRTAPPGGCRDLTRARRRGQAQRDRAVGGAPAEPPAARRRAGSWGRRRPGGRCRRPRRAAPGARCARRARGRRRPSAPGGAAGRAAAARRAWTAP